MDAILPSLPLSLSKIFLSWVFSFSHIEFFQISMSSFSWFFSPSTYNFFHVSSSGLSFLFHFPLLLPHSKIHRRNIGSYAPSYLLHYNFSKKKESRFSCLSCPLATRSLINFSNTKVGYLVHSSVSLPSLPLLPQHYSRIFQSYNIEFLRNCLLRPLLRALQIFKVSFCFFWFFLFLCIFSIFTVSILFELLKWVLRD